MTMCVVTDIDGTIATKMPAGPSNQAWETAIQVRPPKPIIPMRTLLQAAVQGGLHIVYATARRETLREVTVGWLRTNSFPIASYLCMRPDDLRLSQDMLKLRYLKDLRNIGWQPVVWFEDDPATIEALRSQDVHAIAC